MLRLILLLLSLLPLLLLLLLLVVLASHPLSLFPLRLPAQVNQIECHTGQQQPSLVDYCHSHGIRCTAYSPISGSDLDDPTLQKLVRRDDAAALLWPSVRLRVCPSGS